MSTPTPSPFSPPATGSTPSHSSQPSHASYTSHPSFPALPSALHSPRLLHSEGLLLFSTICRLVTAIFSALARYYSTHPGYDSLRTVNLAIKCLSALLALEYTIHRAPERITPRQLLRLSKAARALSRLTGQAFDFSPWTSLSPEQLTHLDQLYPAPANPYAGPRLRPHELRLPASGNRAPYLLPYPGATLANVIKKLARILPPDFTPSPILSPSEQAQCACPTENCTSQPSLSPSHLTPASTASIPSIGAIPSFPASSFPNPHSALRSPHLSASPP